MKQRLLGILLLSILFVAGSVFAKSDKVKICHATDSGFEAITVSENAIGGHFENNGTPKAGHEDDLLIGENDLCPGETPPPGDDDDDTPPPTTQCSDGVDNEDSEDTLVDMNDPGCDSPEDNDESNTVTGDDDDDTPPVVTQCSDGVDNADAEDELVDVADPGCDSPTDDDETNIVIGDDDDTPPAGDDDDTPPPSSGDDNDNGGGSDGSHRHSSSRGSVLGASTHEEDGQVLDAQVSVVPVGAPKTGGGWYGRTFGQTPY